MSEIPAPKLRVVADHPPLTAPGGECVPFGSLTAALGVAGCRALDPALLAALASGDPVLLVGDHGSAKTTLARRLAAALGLGFHPYDASKALFEDVIGFPSPRSLNEGKRVEYVPTPLSLQGKEFILIDEISRAVPSMQNKWLEVVRARQVMGERITSLKYVFAAMNPPSYLGAHPLDEALAGRFAFVLQVPGVASFEEADRHAVIDHLGEEDAPLLKRPRGRGAAATVPGLATLLEAIRHRWQILEDDPALRAGLTLWTDEVFARLRKRGTTLDGRRLSMLRRNAALFLAVATELAAGTAPSERERGALLHTCLRQSLPGIATGHPVDESAIAEAHRFAIERMRGRLVPKVVDLSGDVLEWSARFLERPSALDAAARDELATTLLERVETAKAPSEAARAVFALWRITAAIHTGQVQFRRETTSRLLSAFLGKTEVGGAELPRLVTLVQSAGPGASAQRGAMAELDLATRVAVNVMSAQQGSPFARRRHGNDSVAEFREARDEFRRLAGELAQARDGGAS